VVRSLDGGRGQSPAVPPAVGESGWIRPSLYGAKGPGAKPLSLRRVKRPNWYSRDHTSPPLWSSREDVDHEENIGHVAEKWNVHVCA